MEINKKIAYLTSCLFGYLCLGLSLFVSVEVVMRKAFSKSLQGADELGGYVLAIGSTLAFCIALIGNNHIRIDIFHYKFPARMQAWLNWIAQLAMFFIAFLLAFSAVQVLMETISYGSTAPTPWATPLHYPQIPWTIGLVIFFALACYYLINATWLLVTGRWDKLRVLYQPKGSADEVKEELRDLEQR
ncbi:MAG: TRAP transporter small permease [Desulfofustis sp.]|nr:TRAP transporter small permease [Desulfofustis sp.]